VACEPVDAAARDGVPEELVEGGGKDGGRVEVKDPGEGADGLVETEGEHVRGSGAEAGDKDVAGGKEGQFCFFVVGFEGLYFGGGECGGLVSGGGVGGNVGGGEGDDETACAADSGFDGFLTAGCELEGAAEEDAAALPDVFGVWGGGDRSVWFEERGGAEQGAFVWVELFHGCFFEGVVAVLFCLWVCGFDAGEEGGVGPFVWGCFECAGAEADGVVEPVGEEDADVGVGLVVEGGGVFWGGGGDAEEVGDVFGEGEAPLTAESGDARGEDFEVGWGELGRVSGSVGREGGRTSDAHATTPEKIMAGSGE